MPKLDCIKDFIFPRFGKLIVISPADPFKTKQGWNRSASLCLCDCGRLTITTNYRLKSKNTKSCGCLVGEKHGMENSIEYSSWLSMKGRCLNKNNKKYPSYGGRGIKIFELWVNSFKAFYGEVGPRPSKKHSIDRIDNDLGYIPGNVKWSTPLMQNRNKRNVKLYKFNNLSMTIPDWAEYLSLPRKSLWRRLKSGWTIEKSLTTPFRKPIKSGPTLVTFNGKTLNIAQWSKETGIAQGTIGRRIRVYGWSIEKALTTPVQNCV